MSHRHSGPGDANHPSDWLARAVAFHQSGQLDQAVALYERVLQQVPRQFDATHLLGVAALQRGELGKAESLIRSALEVNPNDAAAHNNLGTVLLRASRLDDARLAFERAARLQPGYADAQTNLGTVLYRLGRPADAVGPLRRALNANPASSVVCNLLGAALLDSGAVTEAGTVFQAAVEARPGDAAAWIHLAVACNRDGQHQRALECADRALKLTPGDTSALGQRASALAALARPVEAREAFQEVTRLVPKDAAAHNNLGAFLRDEGDLDAAIAVLGRAVELDPALLAAQENLVATLLDAGRTDEALARSRALAEQHPDSPTATATLAHAQFEYGSVEDAVASYRRAVLAPAADAATHYGFGNALMAMGDAVDARRQYRRAIEIDPRHVKARWALAMGELPPIYEDAASLERSRGDFARAVAQLGDWFTEERAALGARAVGSTQPFYLAYHPYDNRALLEPYGRLCARLMAAAPIPLRRANGVRPRGGRLRLGFASAHVREHSVWNAITSGWIKNLDQRRFEVFVFHLGRTSDGETVRTRRAVGHFVDTPSTPAAWAQTIADAQLDVLIYPEIGMDPLTTQLAARRLARVQATTWGHPHTTGLPTIDLFLSGERIESPKGEEHYSERLVRLPNLGVCVAPRSPAAVNPDLAALGLPVAEPLLLCPGTPFKYSPIHDPIWAGLGARLQAHGRGRLVFFRSRRRAMNERLEVRLRRAFDRAGADFDRTVCLIPTLDRPLFYGLMQVSAMMLDSIGFSGFNTALQGLECGLPVVAYEGEFMRGRLASGTLRRLGLDEWVAVSAREFEDKAMRLVGDESLRLRLRGDIAVRRPVLFDDVAPVRALEQALIDAAGAQ